MVYVQIANVIFIDSPVGTGYSYATQPNSYNTTDTLSAKHTLNFLKKVYNSSPGNTKHEYFSNLNLFMYMQWLLSHPAFIMNDLYIAGDSYGGKMVPMVVLEILKSRSMMLNHHELTFINPNGDGDYIIYNR